MKKVATNENSDPRDIIINHIVKSFTTYCKDYATDVDLAHLYDAYAGCRDCPLFCEDCFSGDCSKIVLTYFLEKRTKK